MPVRTLDAARIIQQVVKHSREEVRRHAPGRTDNDRWLHITFTERSAGTLIRPISAGPMSRKERIVYEQAIEAGS
jgi:uncharacterized DUF497 family protein